MMWEKLGKNSAWTLLAALLFSGAELFSGYAASQVNVNLENLTTTMMTISDQAVKNSEKIDQTQKHMLKLQGEVYKNFDDTQRQMIELQKQVYNRVWEQDKVISQIRRDTVLMERENIIRREILKEKYSHKGGIPP